MTRTEPSELRRRTMRAVKSKDTGPELLTRRMLHAMGYRFRLHRRDLPGVPDLVFSGRKKLIFIHGCFWHGHDCRRGARQPKENAEYWRAKIARNQERDSINTRLLLEMGWKVLAVWECELKDKEALATRLRAFLGPTRQGALSE
ncbi:Type II nicking enzyme V.XorIIP [Azospirillaceae bacterium]